MTWYIIVFILCVIGFVLNNYFIKNDRTKKIVDILLIIFLCIITGTRYNIGGYDYNVYEYVYNNVPKLSNFDFSTIHSFDVFEMEKGYLFLCSICKTIGFTYYGFTLICSMAFYLCLYKGLRKYTKNFTFLIIIFLYKLFIFQTFVLTRQMLCLGGFFLLFKYLKDGKFWKYLIGCIILTTIHVSTIIFIPVYFLRKFKLTKNKLVILTLIFVPTTFFSFFNISIIGSLLKLIALIPLGNISTRLLAYASNLNSSVPINILNTIEYLILMCFIIYRYDDLVKNNDKNELWIKLFLVMLPILTMFRGHEVLARMKDYFVIVYAFIIEALLLLKPLKFKLSRNIIYLGLITLCFVGYIRYINNFGDGVLLPYNSYVNDNVEIINFKE